VKKLFILYLYTHDMDKYTSREVNRDGGGKKQHNGTGYFFLKKKKYVERSPPNYRHNRNSRSRKKNRENWGGKNNNKKIIRTIWKWPIWSTNDFTTLKSSKLFCQHSIGARQHAQFWSLVGLNPPFSGTRRHHFHSELTLAFTKY